MLLEIDRCGWLNSVSRSADWDSQDFDFARLVEGGEAEELLPGGTVLLLMSVPCHCVHACWCQPAHHAADLHVYQCHLGMSAGTEEEKTL